MTEIFFNPVPAFRFSLRFPHREGKWNGGRSAFGSDLLSISINETFIKNVRAILIVSDRDTEQSFAEVQNELRKVKTFPIPTAERVAAKAKTKECPHIVILMVPMDKSGNLETLCLESAYAKWG
jgi:hypothetical protein